MNNSDVFAALAAPKRRNILELLRDTGPMSAGDIVARFQPNSQPGISRHLKVLRECGLVKSSFRGRQNVYALEPGLLDEVRDGWLATFSKPHMERLSALRDIVEQGGS